MPPVITVENVSKRYQLGETQHTMLRDAVMGAVRRLLGRSPAAPPEEKWALKDVSFEIRPGEVVGLVGRNGAGKSTLLKVLSQITYPTSGRVDVQGRVGSLLEVGTGFHDELTGRENVYMNGSILGMRKREIDAALPQIIDFAEIGPFLDTPIKRYSSGMRMRLGFAVAAHLNTDVLFVDEVLAVGDVSFQKKCLGAMREVADGGRTVIFVSHNMAAVENLCTRCIWIAEGQLREDGDSRAVIRSYLNSFSAETRRSIDLTGHPSRTGAGGARITKLEVLDHAGRSEDTLCSGDPVRIRLHYRVEREVSELHFGVRIYSNMGTLLTDAHTWTTKQAIELAQVGEGCMELQIDMLNLMPGSYSLSVWAGTQQEWHDVIEHVTQIDIQPSDYYGTGRGVESRFGLIFLPFRWQEVACDQVGEAHLELQSTDGERMSG
jgi:lipopolysaccharide transport system ATP-binding protein